ncbi:hypothetical protein Tco_0073531 [Tanacetum coccineum]
MENEALKAYDAARNLKPLVESRGEQGDKNGDNYEGGNGGGNGNGVGNGNEGVNGNGGNRNGKGNGNGNDNGNGNGNGGGNGHNFRGLMPIARECTYQDFLKCQPLNFNGTKVVVGLTRWFEKMETVFHISNCPQKYQVKYATCTLLNNALTWWNSHKRAIGFEASYAMKWTKLMKLMTEVKFQELVSLYTRMVPDEEDKVERFIVGFPDNIQGNVIAAEPTRLQDAIRVANNLMDQKLKGYARNAENKRRLHHDRPCTMRYGNCKRVGHMTRDCTADVAPNIQRIPIGNQPGTFLLNNCYASMLFDSGADRSFVLSIFSALLDVAPHFRTPSYVVGNCVGRISETNVVLRGCTHAVSIYDEKIVRIPYEDEVLIIRGDDCDGGTQVTSKKAEDKSEEKRL